MAQRRTLFIEPRVCSDMCACGRPYLLIIGHAPYRVLIPRVMATKNVVHSEHSSRAWGESGVWHGREREKRGKREREGDVWRRREFRGVGETVRERETITA